MRGRIIGAGIIPGGMEMMDRPAIHAAEEFVHAGYPLDVEALLIVELDGPQAEVDHLLERVEAIARECRAVTSRTSTSEEERLLFWAGRKAAFPAVGRISPDYYCMDGTIPRAKLPQVLAAHARTVGAVRPARRQRVPCRRRQPASADPLRRQQAGRAGARRGVRRRDPEAVRRGRRRAHRRARRRRGEARPDAGDVLRDRPRTSSSASNAPSTPRACSIPARCFRPCTAAPSSAACMCMPAGWRFRIFRGSERSDDRHCSKPRDAKDVEAAVAVGARREARRFEIVGPRLEARHRPRRAMGPEPRPVGPLRRHALRAGGTGALRQGRHAARRDRGAARRATTRSSRSSRWTTARSSAATAGRGTLGGALAANLSGPRRIKAGAARDHFLGFTAVSGRGETFKSGGRVVKNVTGYDLCKLLAGSWGTLAAMTDVTVKVLPRAETEQTLLVLGLDDAAAARGDERSRWARRTTSPAPRICRRRSRRASRRKPERRVTALRLEGVAPSVAHRRACARSRCSKSVRRDRGARGGGFARALAGGPRRAAVRRATTARSGASRPRRRAGMRSPPRSGAGASSSTTGPAG